MLGSAQQLRDDRFHKYQAQWESQEYQTAILLTQSVHNLKLHDIPTKSWLINNCDDCFKVLGADGQVCHHDPYVR